MKKRISPTEPYSRLLSGKFLFICFYNCNLSVAEMFLTLLTFCGILFSKKLAKPLIISSRRRLNRFKRGQYIKKQGVLPNGKIKKGLYK